MTVAMFWALAFFGPLAQRAGIVLAVIAILVYGMAQLVMVLLDGCEIGDEEGGDDRFIGLKRPAVNVWRHR